MSGITSSVGVFSGIDRDKIISQLLAIEGKPRSLAQQRVVQLQGVQTSLLDINTRLSGLKRALSKINISKVFDNASATSSKAETLTATAAQGTPAGTYNFTVDRLVSTQQLLSRGFADSSITGLNAGTFTIEPAQARLDRSTKTADLNGGQGIVRGKVVLKDSSGQSVTVDLTKVETLSDVVKAFNDASGGRVQASTGGDNIILLDQGGGSGTLTLTDASGTNGTVASLGLGGGASGPGTGEQIFGSSIVKLGERSALRSLNDGRGVFINKRSGTSTPDIVINTRDGSALNIDLGDIYQNVVPPEGGAAVLTKTSTAVNDLAGVIQRINAQSGGKVTASIGPQGTGLRLVDNTAGSGSLNVSEVQGGTTAKDLGLTQPSSGGVLDGRRLIARIDSTLTAGLRGGQGLTAGQITVTTRDGTVTNFTPNTADSVADLLETINAAGGTKFKAELDRTGTSITLTDLTAGGGSLSVSGTLADQLGLTASNVSAGKVTGRKLDRQYIAGSTDLGQLNGGKGLGTGQFSVTDSYGVKRTVNVGTDLQNVDDLIGSVNGQLGGNIKLQINSTGNGLEFVEVAKPSGPGGAKIRVDDLTGGVAKALNLAGEAAGTGVQNRIDGSYRRKITFGATDTLQQVAEKITSAGAGVLASVVNDFSPSLPFRLNLTSKTSGEAGRFVIDTGNLDLDFATQSEGQNARVFYGSADPARAVLLSSSSNTFTNVVPGLTVDAKAVDANPATITVTRDSSAIESALDDFTTAFNNVLDRIDTLTRYDAQTKKSGPLLGDGTVRALRAELVGVLNSRADGIGGRFQFLAQVGLSINSEGNLAFNKDKFREAMASDPDSVKALLANKNQAASSQRRELPGLPGVFVIENTAGQSSALGIAQKMADAVDKYVRPVDGVLVRRGQTLDSQIRAQNDRVAQFTARLDSRREILSRQFTSMEETIGRLQSQQGALSSIQRIA
jgi:flagellar hook-associated protein 2